MKIGQIMHGEKADCFDRRQPVPDRRQTVHGEKADYAWREDRIYMERRQTTHAEKADYAW